MNFHVKYLARTAAVSVIAAVLAASLLLAGCIDIDLEVGPVWGDLSTYLDSSALSSDGDRVTYAPGGTASRTGVDVSEYQGDIDWDAVAADGISFAFVQLGYRGSTEGGLYADDLAYANIVGAQAAGIEAHGYFFSQALNVQEAYEEADFAIAVARSCGLSGCCIALDLETEEGRTASMSRLTMEEVANAFCQRVSEAGYTPVVYGNRGQLTRFGESVCTTWTVWLAGYTTTNPQSPCPFSIWQYASDGSVAGIETIVDMDLWVADPK